MQMLGTNPEFNLQSIVTAIRSDLSRRDPARCAHSTRRPAAARGS
jgi:hypothetical protein